MRPDLGPESPRKRASFSKATRGCPASRAKFSRALADSRNGKKPLDFSGFYRCSDRAPIEGVSEPFGAAPVRSTIPVITVAAIAAVAVKIPVPPHFALEPVVAPAFPAPKPGQDGEPALLAVIERLVERVGRFRDLLHGRRRGRHILGPVTQPRHRIVRLLLAGIVLRRVHPRVGAIDSELGELLDR